MLPQTTDAKEERHIKTRRTNHSKDEIDDIEERKESNLSWATIILIDTNKK